ncbi:MAG: SpoIIE family protein phosphatase [Treponemataceae bacterium]|nr:SpoIIE family protein phosphatase [Treponemataceae bacterium]
MTKKRLFAFAFALICATALLSAQSGLSFDEMYWEHPSVVSTGDGRFPQTATKPATTYVPPPEEIVLPDENLLLEGIEAPLDHSDCSGSVTDRLASDYAAFLGSDFPDFFIESLELWEAENPLAAEESPIIADKEKEIIPVCKDAVIWEEIEVKEGGGQVWLSGILYSDESGVERKLDRFAGPFPYAGEVPRLFSCALSHEGILAVAALTDVRQMEVFTITDFGGNITRTPLNQNGYSLVAPRIFPASDGSFMLFATQGQNETFSIYCSQSDNGFEWTDFSEFSASVGLQNPFVPTLLATDWGDYVVFQSSFLSGDRYSFQLYGTLKDKETGEWSEPLLLTANSADFTDYDNQNAVAGVCDGLIYLAWERSDLSSRPQIYACAIDPETAGIVTGPSRVSVGDGAENSPFFVNLMGTPTVFWSDNRSGISSLYFAGFNGFFWDENSWDYESDNLLFPKLSAVSEDSFSLVWQEPAGKQYAIKRITPDRTVAAPSVKAYSFRVGRRYATAKAQFSVSLPEDSSFVMGYSYSWSKDPEVEPSYSELDIVTDSLCTVYPTSDGTWYFKARALDYAGNWSLCESVPYVYDITPPPAPVITLPPFDDYGFLTSNTFDMSWYVPVRNGDVNDVVGYTYNLEYMGVTARSVVDREYLDSQRWGLPEKLPAFVVSGSRMINYENRDDGVYAFSVSAIDSAGNIGPRSIKYFALNKYIPYTSIYALSVDIDQFGIISIGISGRGFTTDGNVEAVYVHPAGQPYESGVPVEFTIESDKIISGITVAGLFRGDYAVTLVHPARGPYESVQTFYTDEYGTVKMGDYTQVYEPKSLELVSNEDFIIQLYKILISLAVLCVVIGVFSVIKATVNSARDVRSVNKQVKALIQGETMPSIIRENKRDSRQKGLSFKYRLAFFTSILVLGVVLSVSLTLGFVSFRNQQQMLTQALKERVDVMLESLASGAKAYLPTHNTLELSLLPNQTENQSDIEFASIIALSEDASNTGINCVWASNDPEIMDIIDTPELAYGTSRAVSDRYLEVAERCVALNNSGTEEIRELARNISELNLEGVSLALSDDEESQARFEEIQIITTALQSRLNTELSDLANSGTGSIPEFPLDSIDEENSHYLFYKPVVFRQGSDQIFVRGAVLLQVSTEQMQIVVNETRNQVIQTAVLISLISMIIGIFGSLAMASYIIVPVRKLAKHVEMIRDTEDKEKLAGRNIEIKSRDEIGMLGDSVNEMTSGLVKAAAAAKDLTVGKELQKMFIPLETDRSGRKLTTGSMDDKKAQVFGYYEGAKGVSGDYFDCLKLDDKHYALIKCDVSGKGVPAALIMVEVATLFLNYFKDWSYSKDGYNLGPVVSQINDLIESRGFKGRFAAFTLCIYNSDNGDLYFCNAGDKLIHIYDAAEGKKKTITLQETAAAGVFPSFIVDSKGGFQVTKLHLNPGDVLFLYTDGIEEAKRMFRDKHFNVISCQEPGLAEGEVHGMHLVGQDNEEMSPERVDAIIEAVFSRGVYKLEKYHNPIDGETLEFDFSRCSGTAEDAVMALVSVEKVFRMYKTPDVQPKDKILVDSKIDAFLNRCFVQYNDYCAYREDHPDYPEYKYYTRVKEDSQYDDLTLVALKRKV